MLSTVAVQDRDAELKRRTTYRSIYPLGSCQPKRTREELKLRLHDTIPLFENPFNILMSEKSRDKLGIERDEVVFPSTLELTPVITSTKCLLLLIKVILRGWVIS